MGPLQTALKTRRVNADGSGTHVASQMSPFWFPVRVVKFLGNLDDPFAMFQSDSGGTAGARPLRHRSVAPGMQKAEAPTKGLSELHSMAFGLAVYASQCGSLPHTQDSLPAAGQALPDGVYTRKVPMKGFKAAGYISSPFPKLCLAQLHRPPAAADRRSAQRWIRPLQIARVASRWRLVSPCTKNIRQLRAVEVSAASRKARRRRRGGVKSLQRACQNGRLWRRRHPTASGDGCRSEKRMRARWTG